jgi:glycosidase
LTAYRKLVSHFLVVRIGSSSNFVLARQSTYFFSVLLLALQPSAKGAGSESGGMVIYLEAENAVELLEPSGEQRSTIGSSVPGFSGNGYVQVATSSGEQLNYLVNFPEAGEYAVFFRSYSNEAIADPRLHIDVNGHPSLYRRWPTDPTAGPVSFAYPDPLRLSDYSLSRVGFGDARTALSPTRLGDWFWQGSRGSPPRSGSGFFVGSIDRSPDMRDGPQMRSFIWVPAAGLHTVTLRFSSAAGINTTILLDTICLSRNPNFSPEYTEDFWQKQSIYQIVTDRFFDGDPSNNNATDGTVLVEPNPLVAGQQATIRYFPAARVLSQAQQVGIHRGQDGWNSVTSHPMTKMGDFWTTTFIVPNGAEELNFVFNDGADIWDNNGFANWTAYVGTPAVTLSPDPPVAGLPVTISYNSAGRNLSSAHSIGMLLGYNDWGQDVSTRTMTSVAQGVWTYTYQVPLAATNLSFVFNNKDGTWDNNYGRDWKPATITAAQNATKRQGGDFKGIEMKLDYIKAMGFTAIWMSPVLLNGKDDYHGYAATDFYRIDPRFGTLDELRSLIREAHKRGILVINDVVVNHGSTLLWSEEHGWPEFRTQGYALTNTSGGIAYAPPFDADSLQQEFGTTDPANIFHNFGQIKDWNNPTQVIRGSLMGLDDFRTTSPYVRRHMKEIYTHWIRDVGFDAFRVDTAKHVEMSFWEDWLPAMRSAAQTTGQPNFFQFGEVFDGSDASCAKYTGGPRFDSVADFPLYYRIADVFARGGSSAQLSDRYHALNGGPYSASAARKLVTFIDNHDVPRFLSQEAGGDSQGLDMALAFLFAAPGIPSVYYGTEQDFQGGSDPANREVMFASENFDMTSSRFKLLTRLNYVRKQAIRPWMPHDYAAPPPTNFKVLETSSQPGIFACSLNNLTLVVNTSGIEKRATFDVDVVVPPRSFKLLGTPHTPPLVEVVSPAHGSANVSRSAGIKLTFDQTMDRPSVESAFSMTPPVAGSFSWSEDSTEVTFNPSETLQPNTKYRVILKESACDRSGQIEPYPTHFWVMRLNQQLIYGAPFSFTFFTGNDSSPTAPRVAGPNVKGFSADSVDLGGVVGAGGLQTSYWFEYGLTSAYGSETPHTPLGKDFTSLQVDAAINELASGTTYRGRLVASNGLGMSFGNDFTFRTADRFAAASTGQLVSLAASSVTVSGMYSLYGPTTSYFFEYGFGVDRLTNSSPHVTIGAGEPVGEATGQLTGLLPDTTYFYRLVTVAGTATNRGVPQSFRTLPVKPTFTNFAVESIDTNSARLSALVAPNGYDSEAWLEKSIDGASWIAGPRQLVAGTNTNGLTIQSGFDELLSGQNYFFRGVASNTNGTTFSEPIPFSTARLRPIVETGSALATTLGALRVSGVVNPQGVATGYWVEYESNGSEPSARATDSPSGASTRRLAFDDAESYQSLSYAAPHNNGGQGFGVFTDPFGGTQVGGLSLVSNDRRIDGEKSFAVAAGSPWGAHSGYRPITDAKQFGVFTASIRFDVDNTVGFAGLNLKATISADFPVSELISLGMAPFDGAVGGNTQLVISDVHGRRGLSFDDDLDLRGQIIDIKIEFDCRTGDSVVGVKRREDTTYQTIEAKLKVSGDNVRVAALGYLNANGRDQAGQNLIFDNLHLMTFASVGKANGFNNLNVELSGLNEGEEYKYRFVAYSLSGMTFGSQSSGVSGQTLSGISGWRQKWFGDPENAGAGADTNDFAGDGLRNLAKYALGLDPTRPANTGRPTLTRTNDLLALTFNRSKDATDITYRVDAASDLWAGWAEVWNSSTNGYAGGTNLIFPQTVFDTLPAADAPGGRRFMRLRVTRP